MPQPTLTSATALAHERLYPRVIALLGQVERSASRHPDHPVPAATLAIARTLFAEARKILGREVARLAGRSTADLSALSLGLGQVVALLEVFEATHSGWSRKSGCVAWRPENGVERPVSRLRPRSAKAGAAMPSATSGAVDYGPMGRTRSEALNTIYKRMNEREAEAYKAGYYDGRDGRPLTLPKPLD